MLGQLMLKLSLAALIPFVSDRYDFEDPDKISDNTQQRLVNLSTNESMKMTTGQLLSQVSGKNVLVLVHGYNNPYDSVLPAYEKYINHTHDAYDLVIGYLWPGGDGRSEYFSARGRVVNEIDVRLLALLTSLNAVAKNIDLYAHSMGCRLSLEALDLANEKLVRNLFLTGAAVDDESLETGERYFGATKNVKDVVVFYSSKDSVVGNWYPLAEFDSGLGHVGSEDPKNLPKNVTAYDVSEYIDFHSDYRNEDVIFEKIKEYALSKS